MPQPRLRPGRPRLQSRLGAAPSKPLHHRPLLQHGLPLHRSHAHLPQGLDVFHRALEHYSQSTRDRPRSPTAANTDSSPTPVPPTTAHSHKRITSLYCLPAYTTFDLDICPVAQAFCKQHEVRPPTGSRGQNNRRRAAQLNFQTKPFSMLQSACRERILKVTEAASSLVESITLSSRIAQDRLQNYGHSHNARPHRPTEGWYLSLV